MKEPKDEFHCICIYYGKTYSVKEVLEMVKERDPHLRKGYWYFLESMAGPKEIVKFDASLRRRIDETIIHFV